MSLTSPSLGVPNPVVLSTMTDDHALSCNVGSSTNNAVGTVNLALYFPVRVVDTRTYVKAWWSNGSVANGTVDVGVFTITGTTATLVAASTAETQTGTNVIQVAATFPATTLTPGLYYLALSVSSATATFMAGLTNGSTLKALGCFMRTSGAPLSTGTIVTTSKSAIPIFGLSELATI